MSTANVKDIYKAHYEFYKNKVSIRNPSKYEWASFYVFDLSTYDGELDKLFVDAILEVCSVIFNGKNYDYIVDKENYIKYILVCQILDKFHWIEWGTSIRGAWFDGYYPGSKTRPILEEDGWSEPGDSGEWEEHVLAEVPFSEENLRYLIEYLVEDE